MPAIVPAYTAFGTRNRNHFVDITDPLLRRQTLGQIGNGPCPRQAVTLF